VVLECHPGLESILATLPGISRVVTIGASVSEADVYAPLMSVPHLIGLDAILPQPPYITAPSPADLGAGLKVGLVWRGNPKHENDRSRSIPLALFKPLAAIAGARFFSLQVGAGREELAVHPDFPIVDLAPGIRDFADTARLIAGLDLVVTVDTAVAHLAGAMGKPVWILLARGNDWRWFHGRTDSPWYPTARLFRQGPPRRWEPAIAAAARALAAWPA
jgi:hypothetical protein